MKPVTNNSTTKSRGFTLLELLTVTAIIGTLASVAIPTYQQYSQRARFAEAILAATPFKNAVEVSAFRGFAQYPGHFNSGQNGIPSMTMPWSDPQLSTMIGVWGGTIYVRWWPDGSPLSNVTYTLTAQNATPPIQWVQSGSCINLGYC